MCSSMVCCGRPPILGAVKSGVRQLCRDGRRVEKQSVMREERREGGSLSVTLPAVLLCDVEATRAAMYVCYTPAARYPCISSEPYFLLC